MDDQEQRRALFVGELFGNWGKGMTAAQIKAWIDASEAWDIEQLKTAVKRCTSDREREKPPYGWGEFSRYLPAAVSKARYCRFHDTAWLGGENCPLCLEEAHAARARR